jgi:8-oxo-dGTP pyrophosphatase MutT (NUDIX family)
MRKAVAAIVPNDVHPSLLDRRYLVVWNQRYGFWTLPGGMVEDTDPSLDAAMLRELREETGLIANSWFIVYDGPYTSLKEISRADHVTVYSINNYIGTPLEMEPGSPVAWFTEGNILKWSGFRDYYATVFESYRKDIRYMSM